MRFIKAITGSKGEHYINIGSIDVVYQIGDNWRVSVGGSQYYIKESDALALIKKPKPVTKIDTSEDVIRVIVEFNRITGKNCDIDPVAPPYAKLIDKRLREGATINDFIKVIQFKFDQWGDDKDMSKYVIPSTLFRPSKFTAYLQEAKNSEITDTNIEPLVIF